jgi:hypothetical protein
MEMIKKDVFLASQICLTKGWYLRNSNMQPSLTHTEQFRINIGLEIHNMARSIYPQGILVNEGSSINNFKRTEQLLIDKNALIIFEATFIHNNVIARIDILERLNGEWHLIEVKSSTASDEVKDELLDDLTYSALIANLYGIEAKKMSLLLVSKNYRLGMDNKDFFVPVDCTKEVNNRLPDFKSKLEEISTRTSKSEQPTPTFIYECRDCNFYVEQCVGKGVKYPIFNLPNLNEKKFNKLVQQQIYSIDSIPQDFELTPLQKTVWICVNEKNPSINKEKLRELLSKIIFPAFYLDFECVSSAIPLYDNIRPYQEVVTQYSIHKFSDLELDGGHFEFLSDHSKDDRRMLAERLLQDIGKEGSVIVYHAQAEKRFIKSLSEALPNLSEELNNIISRIVDLKVILKESYYHPAFNGSYSIKDVLPVLVPKMSYKELAVGDGQSANIIFAELARGKYSANDAELARKNLLEYCKQDTLAMVNIHQELLKLAT